MIWMPLRSVKIYGFIWGFHLCVRWPKWTPLSNRDFMETTDIFSPCVIPPQSFGSDLDRWVATPIAARPVQIRMRVYFRPFLGMNFIARLSAERAQYNTSRRIRQVITLSNSLISQANPLPHSAFDRGSIPCIARLQAPPQALQVVFSFVSPVGWFRVHRFPPGLVWLQTIE